MVCQGIKTLLRISISCNLNNFARACPAKNFVEVEMLPWSSSYWREFRSIIPYGTSTGNGKTFVVAEISLKRTSLCRDSTVYTHYNVSCWSQEYEHYNKNNLFLRAKHVEQRASRAWESKDAMCGGYNFLNFQMLEKILRPKIPVLNEINAKRGRWSTE